jgi:hypothetical protein
MPVLLAAEEITPQQQVGWNFGSSHQMALFRRRMIFPAVCFNMEEFSLTGFRSLGRSELPAVLSVKIAVVLDAMPCNQLSDVSEKHAVSSFMAGK